MKFVFLAFVVTFSCHSFAVELDPKCVESLEREPLCVSRLNSELYCARNVIERDPVQKLADCYERLAPQNFDIHELQEICVGDLALSSDAEMNKSFCDNEAN